WLREGRRDSVSSRDQLAAVPSRRDELTMRVSGWLRADQVSAAESSAVIARLTATPDSSTLQALGDSLSSGRLLSLLAATASLLADSLAPIGEGPLLDPALPGITVSPNPTHGVATFDCWMPRAGAATLRILSIEGRPVRALRAEVAASGRCPLRWDGRD